MLQQKNGLALKIWSIWLTKVVDPPKMGGLSTSSMLTPDWQDWFVD